MTLRNLAAASLAALAVAACGDDDNDNNTKPITPDTPAVPEACKALKCVYQTEGDHKGSFVTKNEKGEITAVWDAKGKQTHKLGKDGKLQKIEDKPEPGKTAGEFDLSGEGVTEPLKEPVRGGSNYLRGSNSTFDVKASKPSISSIAQYGFDQKQWNDAMDNFVAGDPEKEAGKKTQTRAMFENIIEQHTGLGTGQNNHYHDAVFNAHGDDKVATGGADLAGFQEDLNSTIEVKVKDAAGGKLAENGSLPYDEPDYHALASGTASADDAWHQEEKDLTADFSGGLMNGFYDTRLYGAKVWKDKTNFTRIANYNGIETPLSVDPTTGGEKGVKEGETLPTAVTYDTLKYVQFGRLSGFAELDKLTDIPENKYASKNLKKIPFAERISNSITSGGVSDATDFYFARGNKPTQLDKMKALNSDVITYHGQALTYGIDNRYHGPQDAKEKEEAKDGSIPNSVPTGAKKDEVRPTLLGSRGNFVVAQFAPAQGKVEGSIYNVWNVADFYPIFNDDGTVKEYRKLKLEGTKVDFDTDPAAVENNFQANTYKDVRGYKDNLISFSGAVNGNKIEGDAVRYDKEKGKFLGAFFGDNAEEMGGVISSAVKYGQKPNEKWGAVFGVKALEVTKPGKAVPSIPKGPASLGWSLERE